jgi:hypothetical protein
MAAETVVSTRRTIVSAIGSDRVADCGTEPVDAAGGDADAGVDAPEPEPVPVGGELVGDPDVTFWAIAWTLATACAAG